MPELDDAALERRLRGVLKEHLGALPLDLTVDALDRRREAKGVARRSGRGRGITLLAAAALLLVGGALAAGSGLLRLPTVVPPVPEPSVIAVATASPDATSPSPSESAAPSASPIPVAGPGGVWIPVGSMVTPRDGHDAVRLLDGRVFVVGGDDGGESDPTTAELYDPVSGTWSATGNMLNPHLGLPPTLLLDGRVLVGDVVDGSNGTRDVYGSELYDPATGTWSATGKMIAVLGRPGRGAARRQGARRHDVPVYDPATGTWTATGKRNNKIVYGWAATLLSDGKVLAAGGWVDNSGMSATDAAEVYDPVTGSWTEIANMQAPHGWWDATLRRALRTQLRDGKVLVMSRGGSWEVYDLATGTWTAFPAPTGLDVPRAVLSDGTVLMTDLRMYGGGAVRLADGIVDHRFGHATMRRRLLVHAPARRHGPRGRWRGRCARRRCTSLPAWPCHRCQPSRARLRRSSRARPRPRARPRSRRRSRRRPVPFRRTLGAGPSRSTTRAPSRRPCSWAISAMEGSKRLLDPRPQTWSQPAPPWR